MRQMYSFLPPNSPNSIHFYEYFNDKCIYVQKYLYKKINELNNKIIFGIEKQFINILNILNYLDGKFFFFFWWITGTYGKCQ